jgi:hypothetical protein
MAATASPEKVAGNIKPDAEKQVPTTPINDLLVV